MSQRGEAVALMERVLRPAGSSLVAEYPLVFAPGAPGAVVPVAEQGGVRAACALLVRDLLVDGLRLRVGMIGSVSTDPAWRRRGLASRALRQAERRLTREGCLLALLWADDPAFYLARGWRPCGHEIDFALAPGALARCPERGAREAAEADADGLHGLYAAHAQRVDRSSDETRLLLRAPGMRTLVVGPPGAPRAYACLGRGADFQGIVHEWGGPAADVLGLLRAQAGRSGVVGIAPPGATALRRGLEALGDGVAVQDGILGLGKVLAPDAAWRLLAERAPDLCVVPADGGGPARLVGPAGAVPRTALDPLDLLLPPRCERGALAALAEAAGADLARLPLRPFVWGLDSI